MRKAIRTIQILLGLMFVVSAVMVLTGTVSAAEILAVLSPSGIGIAFAAGAGVIKEGSTPTTKDAKTASSDLLDNKISQVITKMKPAATPLDTIIRSEVRNVPAKSWKYEFYKVDMRGVEDTLSGAFDTSASGTYVGGGVHTIPVTNAHIWSVDDNVCLIGVEGSDGADIVCNIVAKNASASTLDVYPLNGLGAQGIELPDLDSGQALCRFGNGKSELDAQTDPYTIFPSKDYNYNQIHMAQVEESVYLEMHEKEVNWGMADYKYASIYDLRRGMEFDSLWGVRKLMTDPIDSHEKYFSGGLTRYITRTLSYTEGVTAGQSWKEYWNAWTKAIFSDNAGSDMRYLFVGKDLLETMANIDSFQRQIDAKSVEIIHGITFNRIETPFGVLRVKLHNLFAPRGWAGYGLVLDMAHIEKFTFKPMTTQKLDLITSGQRNANAYKIDEAFGLALRYPDTHAIIAPSASS